MRVPALMQWSLPGHAGKMVDAASGMATRLSSQKYKTTQWLFVDSVD